MEVYGWVALLDAADEVVGFWEVVEGVEEDEWWLAARELREHVDCHETSEAESGGLEKTGKSDEAPFDDFYSELELKGREKNERYVPCGSRSWSWELMNLSWRGVK